MNKLIIALVCAAALSIAGCPNKLTPATDVLYEGPMTGNDTVTYPSAETALETCMRVKTCMGLNTENYPLPMIRGMSGGNGVECGGTLKKGCYEVSDGVGWIIMPQGAETRILAHECVHHWMYTHTGEVDSKHESGLFLACGGDWMLD